tara:strand:+ start:4570 stop:5706 length:1137 start_codon:yes stop_codon:yes gene_type:complete
MLKKEATLDLAKNLIARPSMTPDDGGCQELLIERLQNLGFIIHRLPFDDVKNFWAVRGDKGPMICFAGHTDVVPPGSEELWESPPFVPEIRNGYLYGRGAADMKSSLAAMVVAAEIFIRETPSHSGRIAFLITSDEEGLAESGTKLVVEWLRGQNIIPDWCIVGEPTSTNTFGDVIKHGRRGSLNGVFRAFGVQGHVAYPESAVNPIHASLAALFELTQEVWDEGCANFQPTSFQISNIHSGDGITNVIPAILEAHFNFRYSTKLHAEEIKTRTFGILEKHNIDYSIDWEHSGKPFLTISATLVSTLRAAISETTGQLPELSTTGGTSDGRFISTLTSEVVEFGPINASIHQANEHISVGDLQKLTDIYRHVLIKMIS